MKSIGKKIAKEVEGNVVEMKESQRRKCQKNKQGKGRWWKRQQER